MRFFFLMNITLQRTTSENPHFKALEAKLDAYIKTIDKDEFDFFNQFNKSSSTLKNVIIVQIGLDKVGCGAFRPINNTTIEIKRMFIEEAYRGHKIAEKLLNGLEQWAIELGYSKSILETAIELSSAHKLYINMGYYRIPNYDQYIGIDRSICFEKKLQ